MLPFSCIKRYNKFTQILCIYYVLCNVFTYRLYQLVTDSSFYHWLRSTINRQVADKDEGNFCDC